DIAIVEQIARMRRDDVGREAAMADDADGARLVAKVLVAGLAAPAFAAADPRVDDAAVADLDPFGVGSDGDDHAGRLMAGRAWQGDAALGQRQHIATAEIVGALPEMQV